MLKGVRWGVIIGLLMFLASVIFALAGLTTVALLLGVWAVFWLLWSLVDLLDLLGRPRR